MKYVVYEPIPQVTLDIQSLIGSKVSIFIFCISSAIWGIATNLISQTYGYLEL